MSKHITLENLNVALPPIKYLIDKKAENVDWNENDPAASGYIRNRPFYSYNEAVDGEYIFYETAFAGEQQGDNLYVGELPESSFDFETLIRLFPIESDLENADFVVVYDNETYENKCFIHEGMPCLGNLNLMGGLGEDTGEPFLFLFGGGIGVTTPGEHTISVKTADTIEKKYVKIDEKYLPELVVVDDSLSNYGAAADAGATGEAINTLQDLIGDEQVSTQISRAINSYDHIGKRGTGSKAEIFNNAKEASGTYSHAEGYNTTASGNNSHAEGEQTTASGGSSHAEGYYTRAQGNYSSASGMYTRATNQSLHVIGEYNLIEEPIYSITTSETKGNSLIAWGSTVLKITGTPQFNENTGIFTFDGVTSVSANSLSVGDCILKDAGATTSSTTGKIYWKYEGIRNSKYTFTIYTSFSPFENRGKYVHMIGNGTSDATRSNAHTLDWDGVGWFAGGLKVGGTGQDDENAKTIATEEYVNQKVADATTNISITAITDAEIEAICGATIYGAEEVEL